MGKGLGARAEPRGVRGARIAVVGGGLAGIAAALECADGGAEVTLYEARRRLGGATFSVERKGHWVDNGQHVTLRCCVFYRDFLRRIGTEHLIAMQPRLRIPVLREGKPPAWIERGHAPAPLHLVSSLMSYAPLNRRERIAAVRAAAALRRLDPNDLRLDRFTFGEWLRARGQSQRAVDALWNLITLPTLNVDAENASLAQAVQVFRTGLLDANDACDIGVAAVPLQQLHGDAAAVALDDAGVRVLIGMPVRGIDREPGGVRISLDDGPDTAHAAIVAVPHYAAGELLPPGVVETDALDELGTSPIVNIHVHYDRRVLAEPLAAALGSPVQWLFDRTASAGIETGQLVVVSLSGADDEIGEPVDTLRDRYLAALARLLPAARDAEVLDFMVTREPKATFRAGPGTRALRPPQRTDVPGLYLAGAWTDTGWPATMEGAVRSGLAAARAALDDLAVGVRAPEEAVA
ncbi:MAG: FAD-dependent oxidoreductase [Actinobacteria bacterium]|nr:FAD-dependent oxidoreductase [Actinomycetota bacterium]